ncbi:CsbD family protein [Streptomyces sp. NPDC051569]|uniref:CsbD family protein n=1 Tax=Streptomyces sp. NPDC051569 TaxID=3365661 RepID=UPI00378959CE
MATDDNAMDKAKGKAKEMTGKATGDDRMASEGRTDQAKAKAKSGMEDSKEKARGMKDSLMDDEHHDNS